MGLLDFFRKNKKPKAATAETETPSAEQLLFANAVLDIISPTLEPYGFVPNRTEVKTYSTTIVYKKGSQYIKVNSTSFPTDYPYYFNIILGEGDSEDFYEFDWNSIALWALAHTIDPQAALASYDFPYGQQVVAGVQQAQSDLLTYGSSFLNGDLTLFYKARKATNQAREPYKIYSRNANGLYTASDEPKSAEQKRKYS